MTLAASKVQGQCEAVAAIEEVNSDRGQQRGSQQVSSVLAHLGVASSLLAALPAHAHVPTDVVANIATTIPGVLGDDTFREGAVSGFLLILFSELGDKTFFIALLLALRQSQGLVFTGTFGALAIMTVISVALGQVLHQLDELLPANSLPLDDIFAAALLVFFGVKTLLDARDADESAAEERDEAEKEVKSLGNGEALGFVLSTFALVFAAEWGDKSFLATIALAAASSPAGVVLGAVGGHGVATGIAVLGGSYLSRYISEKAVQYLGGTLFLVFAAATIFDIVVK
ncbi:GDT1-like protein 1, chloroplastic [Coccomyxa sp. Obi]|nr:GDT1-like protein 1, chloroplastic [Coccomyxa sp. Obi]